MKAAVLKAWGAPLQIETIADPVCGTGEVVVDVVATRVLSYADEVISGARKYSLTLPAVLGPGAIGRVRELGPDATQLNVGDWVYCDPTLRSRDNALAPDILLQGWSAAGEGGLKIQRHFRHGARAERLLTPTENVKPLGAIEPNDAGRWCAMGTCLVPYGGWLAVDLRPGEIALVSGATGNFGSAGVAVALAMGAQCVIAPGRNQAMLADLTRRFGERVRTVALSGDEGADRERMKAASPGPIDCVLDIMPPSVNPAVVRTAVMTARPNGRVALMGGLQAGIELPYSWMMRNNIALRGVWMYPPQATAGMIGLIRSGLLRLDDFAVTEFALDDVAQAIAHAAVNAGAFKLTVLRP